MNATKIMHDATSYVKCNLQDLCRDLEYLSNLGIKPLPSKLNDLEGVLKPLGTVYQSLAVTLIHREAVKTIADE